MSKLKITEKLSYGLGEIGSSIVWQGMMFYLGYFYTDVFVIPPQAAAFLMFLPKFLDALIDPVVGTIADRTNTRWGKFRPYILWFFIPYSVFMILMFATPNWGHTGKMLYAYATYMLMMIIYSLIMTPYNALGGVITDDHKERTSLQSYRFFMAFFGGFILRIATNPLVSYFGGGMDAGNHPVNPQRGFLLTFTVFAVLSAICFFLTFHFTRERIKPVAKEKSSLKDDLKDLTHNRPWIVLFIASTLNLVYVGVFGTAMKYYFDYYVIPKTVNIFGWNVWGLDVMSVFNGYSSIVIMIILLLPVSKWLAGRFGKRNTLIACYTLVAIAISGWYFCKPDQVGLIMFFQFIQSVAAAPTMPLTWSMYADAADYSEWKNGRRATGLIYSAVVLGQKAGIALGGAIPLWILASVNYNPSAVTHSPEELHGIRLSMGLIPGFIALLTGMMFFFYNLSNKQMDTIQAELAERRKQQELKE